MAGTVAPIASNKSAVCLDILRALPEWFGKPRAIAEYAGGVEALPMFGFAIAGEIVGFLALKFHTRVAAEVYVMGVKKPWHRQGAGKQLLDAADGCCRAAGMKFLTVKTLAASHPDPFYAGTRAFYEAIGFQPLEVFPTLWDAGNPCLLMVMPLDSRK